MYRKIEVKKIMRKHEFYYDSQPKTCKKYFSVLILVIFCLIVSTFALVEISNFYIDEPTVKQIFLNSFKSSLQEQEQLANREEASSDLATQQQQLNNDRQARAAVTNNTSTVSSTQKSNSYYEEQSPVVVYSKTDAAMPIALRQMAEVPPKQDLDSEYPFSNAYDDNNDRSEDHNYYDQQEQQLSYNGQQQQQPAPESYYRQPFNYYRESPSHPEYYDDSQEDNEQHSSEVARSSQYYDDGSSYRKYAYATAPPMTPEGSANNKNLASVIIQNNHAKNTKFQSQYREPFPTYTDDYDYLPTNSHASSAQQPAYANHKSSQYSPQNPTPSNLEKKDSVQQMDLLTMFKSLKSMWDLYQSFTSSWNAIAEKRNREEQIAKQKYKQLQRTRINSKKPPKFNTKKNATITANKEHKRVIASDNRKPPASPSSEVLNVFKETEEEDAITRQPLAKVEPRKSPNETRQNFKAGESLRGKRQTANDKNESKAVGEGRYIKGDPLKGYYDFVITEGSYKFWAAFQVGTAILIIYSTFAAIYYSKVNPLVSDYDYTDYLGGARSLSGGDVDFIDDNESEVQTAHAKSWLEWLPRTSHSLKFILDAIDKLPTDHVAKQSEKEIAEANADQTDYIDEIQPQERNENSKETVQADEWENSHENLDDSEDKSNKAM